LKLSPAVNKAILATMTHPYFKLHCIVPAGVVMV